VIAFIVIPRPQALNSRSVKIDWIGAFLVTSSLVLLIFALSEGNSHVHGWAKPYIPPLIVAFALLFSAFLGWQWWLENRTDREPLMGLSIWHHKGFSISMAVAAFFWASFNNYMVYSTYLSVVI
jgi:hypothetical protein